MNILTPPTRADCDAGMIIMEPTEYPPMSGSNLICTVTVLLETGILPMTEPETVVTMDTPAGPVRAVADCRDGKCRSVEFTNVPCFVDRLDAVLEVEGFGSVTADIAYGGMFYAMVDATRLGFAVTADEARELAVLGERVRLAARAQLHVVHPENTEIIRRFHRAAQPALRAAGEVDAQHLHRRPRPLRPQPDRHRHLRPHGGAACPRPAEGRRRTGP